jgi:hypothetical protein
MGLKSIIKVEYFAGDCMKVIGEFAHQLSDYDKLQNDEILAVVESDLKIKGLPDQSKRSSRPRAPASFTKNYHSGNELCRSKVKREAMASSRFIGIYLMCEQLAKFDGLSSFQILALIKSYLDVHIIEVEID